MAYLSILFFLIAPLVSSAQTARDNNDPLQIEGRVEPLALSSHQGGEIVLNLSLPKEFHAYADQFKVVILEPDGFQYGAFKIDPVVEFYDSFSKKQRQGVEKAATLKLSFESPEKIQDGKDRILVEVTYQACSKTYCLFPRKKEISIPFQWKGDTSANKNNEPLSAWSGESVKRALEQNLFLAFVLVFLSGILTSFTPCIFPMIPITLAILGHDSQKRSRAQNFFLSLFYVHGIATTYSILGLIAASSGILFGSALGHPVVLSVLCVIFLLMALSMYGAYELQVPATLRHSLSRHSTGANYAGSYFSGIIAGVVASPCVGPVLVTLLTFVASTQNKLLGFFLLFTYAMGLGVIFLILGVFTELTRRLPRSGPWMDGMKFVLGSFMLGAFFYYLSFLVPQRWHDGALGGSLIIVASFFGAFLATNKSKLRRVQKGLMMGVLVVGIGYLVMASLDLRPYLTHHFNGPYDLPKAPTSSWQAYDEKLLAQAQQENKPVIIDFFADWCLACHELDEKTFSNPEVAKVLEGFYLLRFDATKESDKLVQLREKYKIRGLPTVVFIDKTGVWQEDSTLTEFEPANRFIERINKFKN